MKIRRKAYSPEEGKCCADCDLFTLDRQSGWTLDTGQHSKYGKDIFGTCEVTGKIVYECDRFYCKRYIMGVPYEMRCKK